MESGNSESGPRRLLQRCTCPHCWTRFAPEDVLWVAAHTDLVGDPRLGDLEQQRFLPTRFNCAGNAVDARGFSCYAHACPQCHLQLPRVLLEHEPFIVSILGAPSCGKSVFLTTMTWKLRQILPKHFALAFSDADTTSNASLIRNEEALFLRRRPDEWVPLKEIIDKTQPFGEMYEKVRYGDQEVYYPRPLMFSLKTRAHTPGKMAQAPVIVLYDNSGEDFLIGKDTTRSPVTQHLARSEALLFLFDPLQDPRFRIQCRTASTGMASDSCRQEIVLAEAIARIRRHAQHCDGGKHAQPLFVLATKWDAWTDLLPSADHREPFLLNGGSVKIDANKIGVTSNTLRSLFLRVCPEIVHVAEDFAQQVTYIPVSALGRTPVPFKDGRVGVRPQDIQPECVTVPLLLALSTRFASLFPKNTPAPVASSVVDTHRHKARHSVAQRTQQ